MNFDNMETVILHQHTFPRAVDDRTGRITWFEYRIERNVGMVDRDSRSYAWRN